MQTDLKLPPHSIEAEQAIIGGLIIKNDAYDSINHLRAKQFYSHDHQIIYHFIRVMIKEQREVDIVTLAERLDKEGKLNEVGGIAYIGSLVQSTPSAANIKRYAEIVIERAMLRDLIVIGSAMTESAYNASDALKTIAQAQADIMAITDKVQVSEPRSISDLLPDRFEHYDALFMNDTPNSLSTGLIDLDTKLGGGFEGGDLIIVAGRPSMGKTALAVQVAEVIQRPDAAAAIFSCEMTNGQIVDRIVSSYAKISSDKLRSGNFTDDDWTGLTAAAGAISNMNMLIDDRSNTVNEIASKSRSIKRKHGLSVIVVDYLQLLSGDGDTREQEISGISRQLKHLAKELNVPVIALSQLNRSLEQRANKRPLMSDLRESGAIEQDADIIIFIYRDEVYNPDTPDKGTAELIIGKNRHGAVGATRSTFIGQYTKFENFLGTWEPRPQTKQRKGFNDD